MLANITNLPNNRVFSLVILLVIICLVRVVRSPIQPWLTDWFHWEIAFKVRQEQLKDTGKKSSLYLYLSMMNITLEGLLFVWLKE